jgi:hypothetical protein
VIVAVLAAAAGAQSWVSIEAPVHPDAFDQLSAVEISPLDGFVWAVGATGNPDRLDTWVAHWDGEWSSIPTPGGAGPFDRLVDLSVGGWGVWAVGYTANQSFVDSRSRPLAMRWDGMVWIPTQVPSVSAPDYRLYGVDATNGDDVWAVGEAFTLNAGRPVVVHWDATRWRRVSVPSSAQYARLYAVDALAADDAWAVGTQFTDGNDRAYAVHWDGAAWTEVPVPSESPFQDNLLAVSGSGPDDVWAVGYVLAVFGARQVFQTTAVHWDGTAWTVVPTPDANTESNFLRAVKVVSPNEAYAAGFWDTGTSYRPMIQRWDGAAWTILPSEAAYDYSNELYGIDADGTDAVAVGTGSNGLLTVEALVMAPAP